MSNDNVRTLYARNSRGERTKLKLGGKPKHKRPTRQAPFATIRCRELEQLFRDCCGPVLPNDDAGREDIEILLHHIAHKQAGDRKWLMEDAMDRLTPWLVGRERAALIRKVFRKPITYRADTLAELLGLTYARRQRLGITTIGAIDMPLKERKKLNRAHDREYQRNKRRAAGCQPRDQYESNSVSRKQPWKAEGVSQRTWYRRQTAGNPAPLDLSNPQKHLMHSTDLCHEQTVGFPAAEPKDHYASDEPVSPPLRTVTSVSSA